MRVLAIETSERIGTLAVSKDTAGSAQIVRSRKLPAEQRSAKSLIPAIKALLDECQWQPNQLDLICVTTGPGSFTGLRIGVTAAKTLAYATGADLVEVHTLAAIAAGVTKPWQTLWTILDAQRQELFVARFKKETTLALSEPDTKIMSQQEWLEQLQPNDWVCGPPLAKLQDQLPAGVTPVDPSQWSPRAETVAQLGVKIFNNGGTVDAMQLVPHYYRKSAAEEKADRQQ